MDDFQRDVEQRTTNEEKRELLPFVVRLVIGRDLQRLRRLAALIVVNLIQTGSKIECPLQIRKVTNSHFYIFPVIRATLYRVCVLNIGNYT